MDVSTLLNFIFGRALSGKTHTILNKICEEVHTNNKPIIFIVPEQYSFEAEKAILGRLGFSVSNNIEVLSFTRLVDRIGREIGGISGKRIDDGSRIVIMDRVLSKLNNELKIFINKTKSAEYSTSMVSVISELKQSAVLPSYLLNASVEFPNCTLKSKLKDLSLIMSAYDAMIAQTFIDPLDDLTKLYHRLGDYKFFEGKSVYFDSFKGFTGQQILLVDKIVEQADDVTISLCTDGEISADNELGVFSNVNSVVNILKSVAEKHNKTISEPIILKDNYYESDELKQLEKGVFNSYNLTFECDIKDIAICEASTIYDEATFVARTIHHMVREEGYRFKDFVIIARDASKYNGVLDTILEKYEVPCFMDKRRPVSTLPLFVLVESALHAAISFKTEDVLRYLKTSLTKLSDEEIIKLENYVFVWSLDGQDWLSDWTSDPAGFETKSDNLEDLLKEINEIRLKTVTPIIKLKKCLSGNINEIAEGVFKFIEECSVSKSLKTITNRLEERGEFEYADLQRQSWDALMDVLDRFTVILKNENIPSAEFIDLFGIVISSINLGTIQQKLDEVTFGSADRMRPTRPKVVFLVGVNQGEFPLIADNTGLLSVQDRSALINMGLQISDNWLRDAVEENYLLYTSVCTPSRKLFLSYRNSEINGDRFEPSILIKKVKSIFPKCKIYYENALVSPTVDKIECVKPSFEILASVIKTNSEFSASLSRYFENIPEYKNKLSAIKGLIFKSPKRLNGKNAKELYSNNIHVSATRIDVYHRCKFSYFCKYGLNAKVLRPAELDVLQRGTVVHYVLEKVINRYGKSLKDAKESERNQYIDSLILEYLREFLGGKEHKTPRFMFMLHKISEMLKDLVSNIAHEFSVSDFEPIACELEINEDSDIKPLRVDLESGSISVQGIVDRVDVWNNGDKNYVRVVDYKTGSRKFYLSDVLYGLNLQMLIYLFAISESETEKLGKAEPSGILYMPSKRAIGEPEDDEIKIMQRLKMNGILLNDLDVIKAMENDEQMVHIPAAYNKKNGELSKGSSVIDSESFQTVKGYIKRLLTNMGNSLHGGDIEIDPLDGRESSACMYCDFSSVCGREPTELNNRVPNISEDDVVLKMREDETSGL